MLAAIHNASENIYLALIDALFSFLQTFTTLLTTDLPFHFCCGFVANRAASAPA
jgi:hypothetical protein